MKGLQNMNIAPNNSYIIENAQKIKDLAKDVARMAKESHPMLEDTYTRFVDEGIRAPYFAQMSLKNAEYDIYIKAAEELQQGAISPSEYHTRYTTTRKALSDLDCSYIGERLYNSMKEQAINNVQVPKENKIAYNRAVKKAKDIMFKKIAILSGLAEGSLYMIPCKANKSIKKWTYKFLKTVNK